jgi:hypothetical protein
MKGVEALLKNVTVATLDRNVHAMRYAKLSEDEITAELSKAHVDLGIVYSAGGLPDTRALSFWVLPSMTFEGVETPPIACIYHEYRSADCARSKSGQARDDMKKELGLDIPNIYTLTIRDPLLVGLAKVFMPLYCEKHGCNVQAAAAIFTAASDMELRVGDNQSARKLSNGYTTLLYAAADGTVKGVTTNTRLLFKPMDTFEEGSLDE